MQLSTKVRPRWMTIGLELHGAYNLFQRQFLGFDNISSIKKFGNPDPRSKKSLREGSIKKSFYPQKG